jgi:polysaccharide transporter, PST family
VKHNPVATVLARINSRSGLRQMAANTGWLLTDKLLALSVGVLVSAWVARYLGPAQYGFYSYALAFTALFAPIAELGLANIAVRELVRDPYRKNEILGTTFALQFVAGFVVLMLVIAAAQALHTDDALTRALVGIVASGLVFQSLSNAISYWFQAQVQARSIVVPKMVALLLIAAVKVALILAQAPLIAFAWAALAQTICFMLAITVCYHVSGSRPGAWRAKLADSKRLLSDSWPLIFASLSVVVYMKIDQIMLGNMIGKEALGLYSAAVWLSELWYFLPMIIAASVFPALVRSRERQPEPEHQQRLQFFYDVMVLITYCIVIPLTMLASPLVLLLFGPAYAAAGPMLAVHIWAFIFVSLGVARSQWLVAENMATFAMVATMLGGLVNIGLNLILIPAHGGLGAAWATLIAQIVASYLSSLLLIRSSAVFAQSSLALLAPLRLLALWKTSRELLS